YCLETFGKRPQCFIRCIQSPKPKSQMKTYRVLGLMSGSSMDGIDVAYCRIEEDNGKWRYEIENSECIPYPPKWRLRLQSLVLQNAVTYLKTDAFYGHFLGEITRKFIQDNMLDGKIDFIASH